MGIKRYHDRVLGQISNSLQTSTIDLHRVELERLGRLSMAACQFRHMLADLKWQIARKADLRAGILLPELEMPSRAA